MPLPIMAAMLSCQTTKLTDTEKFLFAKANPLGITLFARNITGKQQLKLLIREIKETIGRDNILIAVDQEGGRVRRLKEPDFRSYSGQAEIGSLPTEQAVQAAMLHAELISADLRDLGINVNFAPVLDISTPQTTEALRSRCFSDNPQTVSKLGKIMTNTYINAGILPCIKHMPGHGPAISDPHLGLPVISISALELEKQLMPFRACRNSPLGMTAHILLPQIDKENPVTQSPVGIKTLIRGQIGFQGLLISDAIDMKALKGNIEDKALRSLNAGCDAVCYCLGDEKEMAALAAVCPKLSDAALERLDKAVQILHNQSQIGNFEEKAAMYKALTGRIAAYRETYDATEVLHQLSKRT